MVDIRYSTMAERLRRTEIRELLKLTRTPGTISFGGGLPDPAIFPYEAVKTASTAVIAERGKLALQYSPTEGEPFLREQISEYMSRHGESARPDQIMAVSSSQQALDLLSKIFIDPDDPIVIERPCYVGAIQAFRAFGADFHSVQTDRDGIIPDELERTLLVLIARDRKPKFIYLIPDFQNPSGINLTLERREAVLRIATRCDLPVIEDSPYRELRFTGDLIPSLYSLDTEHRVIQLKTLSKTFCPGFRIGWIVAPPQVLEKLIMAKQGTDLCTSAFMSILTAYLLRDGHLEKQIEVSKQLYARKASVMLRALDKYMPKNPEISWSHPQGGMFLWLRLPEFIDTLDMITEAIESKVAYVVGSCFYTDGSGRNEMRLNFSYPTEEQIVQGIKRIATLVSARMRTETRVS